MKRSLLVIAAAALTLPSVVLAQNGVPSGASIGGAVGYHTLSGDDFSTADAGVGFQAFFRYLTAGWFGILGGVQYNIHNDDFLGENVNVLGIYAEPRYVIRLAGAPSIAPFVGARGYYLHESTTVSGTDFSANGVAVGGIAGLVIQVVPQVGFETAVTFLALGFANAKMDGQTIPDSDTSGSTLGLHAAFVVSFPSR